MYLREPKFNVLIVFGKTLRNLVLKNGDQNGKTTEASIKGLSTLLHYHDYFKLNTALLC